MVVIASVPVQHRDGGLDADLHVAELLLHGAEAVFHGAEAVIDVFEGGLDGDETVVVLTERDADRLQHAALRTLLNLDVAEVAVHGRSQTGLGVAPGASATRAYTRFAALYRHAGKCGGKWQDRELAPGK